MQNEYSMKPQDLYYPYSLISLMQEIQACKQGPGTDGQGSFIYLSEDLLARILLLAGAIQRDKGREKPVMASSESSAQTEIKSIQLNQMKSNLLFPDHHDKKSIIPKEILEMMEKRKVNLLRAAMEYHGQSLKELAVRYGGNSAAANLANFLSKSNQDLKLMRPSTAARMAEVFDIPKEWFKEVLGISW